jgi:hypothetical protein
VFVLTDWVRAWPRRVAAVRLDACEVGRDMAAGRTATCASSFCG